jgi:hypothetical protein
MGHPMLSQRSKSEQYRDCLPLINSRQLELLDLPRAVAQLCSLERRTARGGRDSIDHAPGAHDDIANAIAGLVVGLGGTPGYDVSGDWIFGRDGDVAGVTRPLTVSEKQAFARQQLWARIVADSGGRCLF